MGVMMTSLSMAVRFIEIAHDDHVMWLSRNKILFCVIIHHQHLLLLTLCHTSSIRRSWLRHGCHATLIAIYLDASNRFPLR